MTDKYDMWGGTQDHRLDMGTLIVFQSCVRCSGYMVTSPWSVCPGSHFYMMVWFQPVIIFPLKTTLDCHMSTIHSKVLRALEGVFFFLFLLPQMCTGPGEYKPQGQVEYHTRFGTDRSRYHCPRHPADVHIFPFCSLVFWSVSGASPSNSAHNAFNPFYYSSLLTHKTFQTLEMVQCIMVFKNMLYLCLNEKNKYRGSFCTCQQYSVKQYV